MSAASLSIGSPVISLSFSRMDEAKRKLQRAQEEARSEAESLSRAISSLQVSEGRLRMKAEALNSLRSRIIKRQSGLQAMVAHIDYAARRFREVDELCAQRISSGEHESARLRGLSTKGGIYGNIAGGLSSLVHQGKAAWDYVKVNGNMILDCVQTGLDIVGLIPGFGEIADGINAGIYLLRGDYGSAALSLAAMVPVLGCAATAGKFINKGVKAYKQSKNMVKAIDTAGDVYGIVKKAGNKGIQKVAGIASDFIEDARRIFGKSPAPEAEGAGTLRGSLSDFGKAGIRKIEETPVQKSFNAAYRDPAAGVNKAADKTMNVAEGAIKTPTQIANSSPIKIPSSANIVEQTKTGYNQIKYTWSDATYKFEARWHTRTPGAPAGQGDTWVVTRTTPGNAAGQQKVQHIMTGENQWTPMKQWQDAVTARQNGTATIQQQQLLDSGHWPAP